MRSFITIILSVCVLIGYTTLASPNSSQCGNTFSFGVPFILGESGGDSSITISVTILPCAPPPIAATIIYQNGSVTDSTQIIISDTKGFVFRLPDSVELSSVMTVEKKIIRVQSSSSFTVLCSIHKMYSVAEFAPLPLELLDSMYVNATVPSYAPSGSRQKYYGGVVLYGVEDSTLISIHSPVPLSAPNKRDSINTRDITVLLQKDETINLLTYRADSLDLTGLMLKSNKKFGALSYHQRAFIRKIPSKNYFLFDAIAEQIPPISRLGTSYYLIPHLTPTKVPTFYRVVAPFDSTIINVNGKYIRLDQGEFYEVFTDSIIVAYSDKPFLVAEFDQISDDRAKEDNSVGDASQQFVLPIAQYDSSYTFYAPKLQSLSQHFVNIIIHTSTRNSFRLDGLTIPDSAFNSIKGSDYFFARIKVAAGEHLATADSLLGISNYGYGFAEGYGYNFPGKGARLLELILDQNPAVVNTHSDCNSASITMSERKEFDSGIDTIIVRQSSNVDISIPSYKRGAKSLTLTATLLKPDEDGILSYTIRDRKGITKEGTSIIKGLTVRTSGFLPKPILYGDIRCDSITLTNYGLLEQTLFPFMRNNTLLSVPPRYSEKLIIPAGDSVKLPICMEAAIFPSIEDVFVLSDECNRQKEVPLQADIQPLEGSAESKCTLPIRWMYPIASIAVNNRVLTVISQSSWTLVLFDIMGAEREWWHGTNGTTIIKSDLPNGLYGVRLFVDGKATSRAVYFFN